MANVKDDKFTYDPFALSEGAQQKEDAANAHYANAPGDYQSSEYDGIAKGYLNQYQNRGPFSYDFNSDALYQQYKDQYIKQGQMAMMDTMGQAAAMTGGYGNSYAQTVGQQVYNQNLGKLNEIMPELYGMAYDKYQQEGQEMLNLYSLYSGLEQENYGKYQDSVNNWFNMGSVLRDEANTAYNREYGNWELGYNSAEKDYYTTRDENFTSTENEKNRTWESEEAQKSRAESNKANSKNELITLIANGYTPTKSELDAVGITEEQAKIYANSNSKAVEYEKLLPGTDAYGIVQKAINGATSLEDLNEITKEYIRIYGEDAIKGMAAFQKRLKELKPKQQNQTTITNNDITRYGIQAVNPWEINS